MKATHASGAEDGTRPPGSMPSHAVLNEAVEVVHECIEVAAVVTVEERRRRQHQLKSRWPLGVEVHGRPLDLEVTGLPKTEVQTPQGHALRPIDKVGSHGVEPLVHELVGLRGAIHQTHGVSLAVIEQLARRVVPFSREQRVESTAQVTMKAPNELGQVVQERSHRRVMVRDNEHRVMDRDLSVALRVRQRIQPAVAHEWVPGA
ncbi:MAG: hypothetical protein ACFCGT_26350 [Sandaracinaceae bacterium]